MMPAVGGKVAEEKASSDSASSGDSGKSPKPILFIVLLVLNMAVVGGVAAMLYLGRRKEETKPSIDQVVQGEHETQKAEANKEETFIGSVIPMETFIVNLAGSRGAKLAKVNLELELSNAEVGVEIDKRKPQLRDIIIILLSSKTYDQVSGKDGKEALRDEIKDTVNSFLTKGQINKVYFTEFIFN